MKIKIKQILTSVSAFKELQEIKFPPTISLSIYKLGKELDKEIEAYRDLSSRIYENHKVPKNDKGFDLKDLQPEQFEPIAKDLDELLESEVEIKDYSIPISVFEINNLPISTNTLIALDWLIKVERE